MGTSLNGLTPAATYSGLIKFGDNSAIGAALRYLSDGAGNDTELSLSTDGVGINTVTRNGSLSIQSHGSTSATNALNIKNSGGVTNLLTVRDDGAIFWNNGNQRLEVNGVYTYYLRSPNGASYINMDGGNFIVYDDLAAVAARFRSSSHVLTKAVAIGADVSPHASAILDTNNTTTKGVRFPNMTTAQKNAITTPAAGLMVFDTTLSKMCIYTGAAWQTITSA